MKIHFTKRHLLFLAILLIAMSVALPSFADSLSDRPAKQTTLVKNSTEPQNEDYKILTLSADSIFKKYGLKEGDTIKTINGKSISAIAKMEIADQNLFEEMTRHALIVATNDRQIDVIQEDALFFMVEISVALQEFARQKLDEILNKNPDPLYNIKLFNAGLPPDKNSSAPVPENIEKTVELKFKKSDWNQLIAVALSDSNFITSSRVVPYFEGGKEAGFKLLSVKPGSLFEVLGFRRGDVWKSFNGQAVDVALMSIFPQKVKDLKTFSLVRTRRGTQQTVTCTVND